MQLQHLLLLLAISLPLLDTTRAADPLPSWNESPTKRAVVSFVARVTREDSADFVPRS